MTCFNIYLSLWGHLRTISSREFKYSRFLLTFEISSFSPRQRSHIRFPGLYGNAFLTISNLTFGSGFMPFSHMNLDNVVADFLLSVVNDWMWPVNRVLKSPSVLPMYFFVMLDGAVVVALYIRHLADLHLPSRGHWRFLQLHLSFCSISSGFISLLL